MKYLEALKKRNLSVENLPKTVQKKIKDLDFQVNALKDVEQNSNQELTDSDLADIEVIRASINELDNHISHKINIFDQAKYDEKLAKISKMTKAKQGIKEEEQVQEPEVEVQEPEVEEPVVAKVVAMNEEPKTAPAPQPAPQPTYVAPPPPTQAPAPVYEEQHEEEEFERKGEGKPKKMTTGILLMGVGAFFLTWGAVNFFKSRK
jgi:FtsZ-interacting cell division protein ZipA